MKNSGSKGSIGVFNLDQFDSDDDDSGNNNTKFSNKSPMIIGEKKREGGAINTMEEKKSLQKADSFISGGGGGGAAPANTGYNKFSALSFKNSKSAQEDDDQDQFDAILNKNKQQSSKSPSRDNKPYSSSTQYKPSAQQANSNQQVLSRKRQLFGLGGVGGGNPSSANTGGNVMSGGSLAGGFLSNEASEKPKTPENYGSRPFTSPNNPGESSGVPDWFKSMGSGADDMGGNNNNNNNDYSVTPTAIQNKNRPATTGALGGSAKPPLYASSASHNKTPNYQSSAALGHQGSRGGGGGGPDINDFDDGTDLSEIFASGAGGKRDGGDILRNSPHHSNQDQDIISQGGDFNSFGGIGHGGRSDYIPSVNANSRRAKTAGPSRGGNTLLQNRGGFSKEQQNFQPITQKQVESLKRDTGGGNYGMFIKGMDGSGGGGPNRSITGMSQGSYPIAPTYPDRAGSSRVPAGDILDQQIGSQIGPQQTGAISGRSSNARRSFDALDQFGGLGGVPPQQSGGYSPSRKIYNNTNKNYHGGSGEHSNLLAPPQPGGGLAQLFSPQMDKAFSAGGQSHHKHPRSVAGGDLGPNNITGISRMNDSRGGRMHQMQGELHNNRKQKDQLLEQISSLKRQHGEGVEKIKLQLKSRETRVQIMEQQYSKFNEDLRNRHKRDIEMMQEEHKKTVEQLIDQKSNLQAQMEKNVTFQRERLQTVQQAELANRDKHHQTLVERQRKLHQEQLATLKRQLDQQISANKFLQQVRESSNTVEVNMRAMQQQRDTNLAQREMILNEKERQITKKERENEMIKRNIQIDRETVSRRQLNAKKKEDEINKQNEQQSARLYQQLGKMQRNKAQALSQIARRQQEAKLKQKQFTSKQQRITTAKQRLQMQYKQKFDQLTFEKKMFEKQKQQYQKIAGSQQKTYQAKLIELQQKKATLAQNEIELKRRQQLLTDRQIQLRKDSQALSGQADKLQIERRGVDQKAKQVTATLIKVHEESEVIFKFKNSIDTQRSQIEQGRFQLQAQRAQVKAERLRVEQIKTQINARQKSFENMRFQYVQDVGEGKFNTGAAAGLNNPRLANIASLQVPQIPSRLPATKNAAATSKMYRDELQDNSHHAKIGVFNADAYITNLDEKIRATSGGTGDYDHNKFVNREAKYLLNLKREYEQRQTDQANSLHGAGGQSRGTFLNLDPGFNSGYGTGQGTGAFMQQQMMGGVDSGTRGQELTKSMLEKDQQGDNSEEMIKGNNRGGVGLRGILGRRGTHQEDQDSME